jgi:Eukaryotic aspartyl protease
MSGISLDGTSISSSNLPAAVLLDSGTTYMYLPSDITKSIYNQVGASMDSRSGRVTAFVPCALANQDRTIDFTFSGIKISVPFNEVVLPPGNTDASSIQFGDGTPACVFGIVPSQGSTSVLGDTFLRSAYVVHDLAHNQISLAQTNFNSTEDNIKEIGVGPGGVPDASMVQNPITSAKGIPTPTARLATVATPNAKIVSEAPARAAKPLAISVVFVMLVGVILV